MLIAMLSKLIFGILCFHAVDCYDSDMNSMVVMYKLGTDPDLRPSFPVDKDLLTAPTPGANFGMLEQLQAKQLRQQIPTRQKVRQMILECWTTEPAESQRLGDG